jgi:hypothetical protein
MESPYVIIGIHGLANKPEEATLRKWWMDSIVEGLKRNEGRTSTDLSFDIVYWRDWRYPQPVPDAENDERYEMAKGNGPLPTYKDGWIDEVLSGVKDVAATPLDWAKRYFGFDAIADEILRLKLEDLALYYDDSGKRTLLRKRFEDKVGQYLSQNKRVMIIAHSMGSIIAYDTLRRMGRENPAPRVEHFVTIGSPLGLPHVKAKIHQENDLVRTPSIVRTWTNFADRRDPVSIDTHLDDDFQPNDRGVRVRDDLVINGYRNGDDKANHHKSYGYLRAPEVSKMIRTFL